MVHDPINNKPVFIQLMAWHRKGNKQLHELTINQFTLEYTRH